MKAVGLGMKIPLKDFWFSFEGDTLKAGCTSGLYQLISYDVTDIIKNNQGKTLSFCLESSDFSKWTSNNTTVIQLVITESSGTNKYMNLYSKTNVAYNYSIPSSANTFTSATLRTVLSSSVDNGASELTITKPMLYFGDLNNPPAYEPYTNGPSPNPDYPQDIEIIEGSVDVEVFGKNVLKNITSYTWRNNGSAAGVNHEIIDDYVKVNLPTENPSQYHGIFCLQLTEPFPEFIGKEVVYSFYAKADEDRKIIIQCIGSSTIYTINLTTEWQRYGFVVPSLNNTQSPTFYSGPTLNTSSFYIKNIMLEEGSRPSDYEPYKKLTHIGKNMFDKDVEKKAAWVDYAIGNTPVFNSSSATYAYINCAYLEKDKVYTLSWRQEKAATSTNQRVGVIVGRNNIILEYFVTWVNDKTELSITPKNNGYLIMCTDINATDIQIEEGSATEYEPYKKPSIDLQGNFIAKLGDIKDEIDVVTGKLTKRIGKVVLDGSETWTIASTYTNTIRFQNKTAFQGAIPNPTIISDKFVSSNNGDNNDYEHIRGAYSPYQDYGFIFLNKTRLSADTVEAFKTWLAQNNVEVYYVLAEPYEVQLDTTKIPLFEGINNVKVITNLEPSLTELDYYLR